MRLSWRYVALGLTFLVILAATIPPATAQQSGPGTLPLSDRADGARLDEVTVSIRRSGGNSARDSAIEASVNSALSALVGRSFNRLEIERRLSASRMRMGPGGISWRLLEQGPGQGLILLVEIDTTVGDGVPGAATGLLSPDGSGFPVLYRDERSLVTSVIGGGLGLYSDSNPWFGRPSLFNGRNPLAGNLPGNRATWNEGYLEYGQAAAIQLGNVPLYLYGMLTGMTTWSLGQDIFRDDARSITGIERGYAGLLYVDPQSGDHVNLSAGRQTFTLNDGFLINMVKGSANAGPRGASYLGPRLANDFSVLFSTGIDDWTFRAFYIDPNELGRLESDSTFLGANLRYDLTSNLSVDATYIGIPESKSSYANPYGVILPREGLRTAAGHVLMRNALDVPGLWGEAELAHQSHEQFDMSAWAGYGLVGYRANDWPLLPSLSYRYARFSGDDPNTRRYERFDPLLSTGLGIWLQGLNFGKVTSNSNLETHRVQANVNPQPGLNFTLDWHVLRTPERYNAGGNPALTMLKSSDIGQEFTLSARWSITRTVFFQSFVSVAVPGRALRDIGADRPWTTIQASLYWSL
jgi:hypothetical protein